MADCSLGQFQFFGKVGTDANDRDSCCGLGRCLGT